jgi:putative transposase
VTSPTIHYPGAFYHVMLRGNRKQPIFRERNDYRAFEAQLATSLLRGEARCHAFCWMNNHVHLLIQVSANPLHKVIHRVATTYAGWFNRKYDWSVISFRGATRHRLSMMIGTSSKRSDTSI